MQRNKYLCVLGTSILFLLLISGKSSAWIYPEHRDIAVLAIEKLDDQYRSMLDNLWIDARKGYENRLTENIIDPAQSIDVEKIDFAAWPAISGHYPR